MRKLSFLVIGLAVLAGCSSPVETPTITEAAPTVESRYVAEMRSTVDAEFLDREWGTSDNALIGTAHTLCKFSESGRDATREFSNADAREITLRYCDSL